MFEENITETTEVVTEIPIETSETLQELVDDPYKEYHEMIITDLNIIAENQSNLLITNMLICSLLGLIIGICFVNIFKGR